MARLISPAIRSLGGDAEDPSGRFDWTAPDGEVHRCRRPGARSRDLPVRRRLDEVMASSETAQPADRSPGAHDFACIPGAGGTVVSSGTLRSLATASTRLERPFDPARVRRPKQEATRDLSAGGRALAARAIEAAFVGECRLLLAPVAVGAGKAVLEAGGRLALDLLDEHRFAGGVVHLRHRRGRRAPGRGAAGE